MHPTVTREDVENAIIKETYTILPNGRTTICQLTLRGGEFTVEGSSAVVSKENFKKDLGEKFAREDALPKVWAFLGYELAQKVALLKGAGPAAGDILQHGQVRTYVGTKVVRAVPMTRGAYNKLRQWELPADENGNDLGYLVEYVDGGQPNVQGFMGYISWSPKDVFERAYTLGVEVIDGGYKGRLLAEFDQLNERIAKLSVFLGSSKVEDLPIADQTLLKQQLEYMWQYKSVLELRVRRAK